MTNEVMPEGFDPDFVPRTLNPVWDTARANPTRWVRTELASGHSSVRYHNARIRDGHYEGRQVDGSFYLRFVPAS